MTARCTRVMFAAVGLAWAGCGATKPEVQLEQDAHAPAPSVQTPDATLTSAIDSGSEPSVACTRDIECALTAVNPCCDCEPRTFKNSKAVPRSQLPAATPSCESVDCGCDTPFYEALAPVVIERCLEGRCQLADLRKHSFSDCSDDSQCETGFLRCDSPCGSEDWWEYYALATTTIDWAGPYKCAQPASWYNCAASRPRAFCASDGHCSVADPRSVAGALASPRRKP
jgi:hypothetical protein